jgi:hypothetical protein
MDSEDPHTVVNSSLQGHSLAITTTWKEEFYLDLREVFLFKITPMDSDSDTEDDTTIQNYHVRFFVGHIDPLIFIFDSSTCESLKAYFVRRGCTP